MLIENEGCVASPARLKLQNVVVQGSYYNVMCITINIINYIEEIFDFKECHGGLCIYLHVIWIVNNYDNYMRNKVATSAFIHLHDCVNVW